MPRKYTKVDQYREQILNMKAEGNQPGDSGISGPRTGNCAPFPLCWSGTHLYTNHIPEESVSVKIGLKRFYKMVDALCVEGVVGAAAVHVNGY